MSSAYKTSSWRSGKSPANGRAVTTRRTPAIARQVRTSVSLSAGLIGTSTVLAKLVEAAGDRSIPGLKTIFCGTAVLTPTLYERARRVFGPVVRVTYGKSEVFNPITVLEPVETDAWYGEKGTGRRRLRRMDRARRRDRRADGGRQGGRRWRGGRGHDPDTPYDARVSATRRFRAACPGAFHDTGDLGYFDGTGRLHLAGRIAEVIKTGGYKVSPEEVERALAPAVAPSTVAVLGIASEYWGQVIVAAVESPQAGWHERIEGAARDLTGYKRPRAFIAMEALPRNGIGKIRRASIRDHVARSYRLDDGPHPRLRARDEAGDPIDRPGAPHKQS